MLKALLQPRCDGPLAQTAALLLLLTLFFVAAVESARAQTLPPGASPERALPVPKPATPQIAPARPGAVKVPEVAPIAVPADLPAGTFVLRKVELEGVTAYGAAELRTLYDEFLNREIPYSEVYGIANRITAKYHADGYALSQAFVPGQSVENGVVRIWVVEGALASFRIDGEPGGNRQMIARYAERLMQERPLRTEHLERVILLMNDLPGLSVVGYVVPGQRGLNDAVLVLQTGSKKTGGIVGVDNRGSKFFGPVQAYATLQGNALLGAGELIEVSPIFTGIGDGVTSWGGFVNVRVPVFSDGAYVQGYLAGSKTRPGGYLKPFDLRGKAMIGTLAVGYPLIREISRYVYLTAQFDYIETSEDIDRDQPFVEDSLRVLRGHLNYGGADRWGGENFVDLRLSVGIDGLGASSSSDPLRSRTNADANFVAIKAAVLRRQSLSTIDRNLRLVLSASGQYSAKPLLSGEEYGLGGPIYLRAYDFYDVSGDYGFATSAELQYGLPLADRNVINAAELFAFYDFGKIWNYDPLPYELDNASLASLGAGIRATIARNMVTSFYVAQPLTRKVTATGNTDTRFFASLGVVW